jgi:formylglycine-generating enzyme required for sulfatase activity
VINGDVIGSNLIAGNNNQASLQEKVSNSMEDIVSRTLAPNAHLPWRAVPGSAVLDNPTYANKLTLSNGMEFMRVPAGKFLMGSTKENNLARDNERPQHSVDIPYDYWMARFPVTNELYNAYVKAKSIKHPVDGWEKKKDHPAVYVSWNDALEYSQWLNNLLKGELPSGLALRLPTEAEWEKAARWKPSPAGRGQGDALSLSKGEGEAFEYPWGNKFDKDK